MVNLHELYGHYRASGRKHDLNNERVVAYGWTDDGSDLTGYYVLTENHKLFYNMNKQFQYMEGWSSG